MKKKYKILRLVELELIELKDIQFVFIGDNILRIKDKLDKFVELEFKNNHIIIKRNGIDTINLNYDKLELIQHIIYYSTDISI